MAMCYFEEYEKLKKQREERERLEKLRKPQNKYIPYIPYIPYVSYALPDEYYGGGHLNDIQQYRQELRSRLQNQYEGELRAARQLFDYEYFNGNAERHYNVNPNF
jgi:hypothetical protein